MSEAEMNWVMRRQVPAAPPSDCTSKTPQLAGIPGKHGRSSGTHEHVERRLTHEVPRAEVIRARDPPERVRHVQDILRSTLLEERPCNLRDKRRPDRVHAQHGAHCFGVEVECRVVHALRRTRSAQIVRRGEYGEIERGGREGAPCRRC